MNSRGHLSTDLIQSREFALRRLAKSLLGSERDVDDVVQETWLAALETSPTRVKDTERWLSAVARYKALRRMERDRRRRRRERVVARAERVEAMAPREESDEPLLALASSVSELSEPYRTVVRLRYFEELAIPEIARRLGRRESTVRSQLHRGLKRLRAKMDRRFHGEPVLFGTGLLAFLFGAGFGRRSSTVSAGATALTAAAAAGVVGLAAAAVVQRSELRREVPEPRVSSIVPAADVVTAPTLVPLQETPVHRVEDRAAVATDVPAALEAPRGSLRVFAVEEGREVPVAALHLWIERRAADGAFLEGLPSTTGPDGVSRYPALAPGEWRVMPHLGDPRTVHVAPGEETRFTLQVPCSIDVDGVVLAGGAPIADASVWVSLPTDPDRGFIAGETDEEGRFQLSGIDPRSWVAARHDAWSPTRRQHVGTPRGSGGVRLGMDRPASPSLRGTVTGPDGTPVEGALVSAHAAERSTFEAPELGADHGLGADADGGSPSLPPPPECVRTAADGSYELERPTPGVVDLTVLAPGAAPWISSVPNRWSTPSSHDVRTSVGAHVAGEVLLPDGSGAAGAMLELYQDPLLPPARTFANREGHFELPHVRTGAFKLIAVHPNGGRALSHIQLAHTKNAQHLDVLLSERWTVAGVARTEDGTPLVGWQVALTPQGDARCPAQRLLEAEAFDPIWATTADDGSFSFAACDKAPYLVRLFEPASRFEGAGASPEAPSSTEDGRRGDLESAGSSARGEAGRYSEEIQVAAWVDDVHPGSAGGTSLALVIPGRPSSSGKLSGELALPLPADTWVFVTSPSLVRPTRIELEPGSGAFRLDSLSPAPYELFVWRPADSPTSLGTVIIGGDDQVSLGVMDPAGLAPAVGLAPKETVVFRSPSLTGVGDPEPVEPGRAAPRFEEPGTTGDPVRLSVEVASGSSSTLVHVLLEHDLGDSETLSVDLLEASTLEPLPPNRLLVRGDARRFRAPPGDYVIRVLSPSGASGEASLHVSGLEPADEPARLRLTELDTGGRPPVRAEGP